MEGEVFGLEEIFKGIEKKKVNSFLNTNNVGVLGNIVYDKNNGNNNVVVSDLQEQVSNDLDEDFDEVMENFLKKTQESEQVSEESITQKDREALSVAALLEMEQTMFLDDVVVLDDDDDDEKEQEKEEVKGVYHHDSCEGKKPVDVERYGTGYGGFLGFGGASTWGNLGGGFTGSLHNHRYHNYGKYISWKARNNNRGVFDRVSDHSLIPPDNVSGRLSGHSLIQPNPWSYFNTSGGVLGGSALSSPSISSSSSSSSSFDGDYTRQKLLLCGVVDISNLRSTPPSSKKILYGDNSSSPSWNNVYGVTLGQSSSSSSSSASWNDLTNYDSFYGVGGGGALPQWIQEANSVGISQPESRFENYMSPYAQFCNDILNKGSSCYASTRTGRKRKETELPEGWECVARPRKNGKSKGQVDKYYINRKKNQRCRSLTEMYRIIESEKNPEVQLISSGKRGRINHKHDIRTLVI